MCDANGDGTERPSDELDSEQPIEWRHDEVWQDRVIADRRHQLSARPATLPRGQAEDSVASLVHHGL